MKIVIKYHGENIEAEILDSYKVRIPDDQHVTIELDQCKNCGVWLSEDEECYGDGYCTECANMCVECEQYLCYTEFVENGGGDHVCVSCHNKEKYKDYDAPFIEVENGDVQVCLEYIGEGSNGDFVNDGKDVPLMRFCVSKKEPCEDGRDHPDWNWEDCEDASYCTQIPVDTAPEILTKLAGIILKRVKESIDDGNSIRKLCQELSWVDEGWIRRND